MNYTNMGNHVVKAAKWSSVTEIAAKIVTPITNMILARIFDPEAFGVVATVSMIISFADMLTDAGFQKYIIQHEFESEDIKYKSSTVAFWTNLGISMFLWVILVLFRDDIATFVGNSGLGNVIGISSVQLLISSFYTVQMALFKREFDFKTLFVVRMILVFIPFIITIPLAIIGFGFWALIIGTIFGQIASCIVLIRKSKWKPNFFYDLKILKEMFSFSIWSLMEAISIWFSAWADMLVIGTALSAHYLGLYKTSLNMVNALLAVVSSAIIPIVFSTLSRLQNDEGLFKNTFYKAQKIIAYCLFPIGLGLFSYSDLATNIMLGSQWKEASFIIGIWSLTSAIKIVFSDLNSECYRAKGMPKLSFLLQTIHLAFLIPTCLIASKYGFAALVYARAFIRVELVLSSMLAMQIVFNISIIDMLKNVLKPSVFTLVMGIVVFGLRHVSNNLIFDIVSIVICILIYVAMVMVFGKEDLKWILDKIFNKKFSKNLK